ncbi:conserved hypothetical protein [anaerobic digester metagenome]|uniref:DUF488 domain-containing protein n=1 Tax=anaerobic digester metagenome TaxID=1263854 RepID=A0A485LY68_9ZZZZ|nr:DUF488 family protein [Candidatus Methanomethylicus sp.]
MPSVTATQSPIITAPLSASRHVRCDQKWLITRQGIESKELIWVPALAPSERLFKRYLGEWKGRDVEKYWPIYVEFFEEELKTKEKLDALRELWHLSSSGISVGLFCYCSSPLHCHRSLIGNFLKNHGATITEYRNLSMMMRHFH